MLPVEAVRVRPACKDHCFEADLVDRKDFDVGQETAGHSLGRAVNAIAHIGEHLVVPVVFLLRPEIHLDRTIRIVDSPMVDDRCLARARLIEAKEGSFKEKNSM